MDVVRHDSNSELLMASSVAATGGGGGHEDGHDAMGRGGVMGGYSWTFLGLDWSIVLFALLIVISVVTSVGNGLVLYVVSH